MEWYDYEWINNKTVLQWFQLVADKKIRETLIKNLKKEERYKIVSRLSSAIFTIHWSDAEEWINYFSKLYELARKGKIKLLKRPLSYNL